MGAAHAEIAPSAAAGILACPARRVLSKGFGWVDDYQDNGTREVGTAAHWAADQYAKTGQPVAAGTVAPNGVAVDADAVQAGIDFVDSVRRVCPAAEFELRVDMQAQLPGCWGTLDAGGILPCGSLFVADFKYGFVPVEVLCNVQLTLYAIGLANRHGLDAGWRAMLQIHQPRAYHRAGTVRSAWATQADALQLVEDLRVAIAQPTLAKPGKHCRTCHGRVQCQALREIAVRPMVTSGESLPLWFAERELEYVELLREVLEAYHSVLQIQVTAAIRDGQAATRFELRKRSGKLEWRDAKSAQRLAKAMGKSLERIDYVTPVQAQKLIGKDAVAQFVARGEGSTVLAPRSAQYWTEVFNSGK